MAAVRTKCWEKKCKGVPFALNDGAARMAEHMGRIHYKCDTCGARWSVTPQFMLEHLPGPRARP